MAGINCYLYIRLPYVLATNVTIEEYEQRTEKFNIHGCWECSDGKIIIYELPSIQHEVCISAVSEEILNACRYVRGTPAQIYGFGATSKY